jgi:hypothetical protein
LRASVADADIIAAERANEPAKRADDHALIAHMKLQIEKLKRDQFGPSSERASRLLDHMTFELEELESAGRFRLAKLGETITETQETIPALGT